MEVGFFQVVSQLAIYIFEISIVSLRVFEVYQCYMQRISHNIIDNLMKAQHEAKS